MQEIGLYELQEIVRTTANGVVHRGIHTTTGRRVAIKLLEASRGQQFTPRALEELHLSVEVASQLEHPAIVKVLESGEFQKIPYVVTELVEGAPLSERLQREGPLSSTAVARMGLRLASALEHAHRRGILHRDLKPSSVLLDLTGQAHLADFELAKLTPDEGATAARHQLDAAIYLAPEQVAGKSRPLDAATDVYALGAVLYTALAGRPPIRGGRLEDVMDAVLIEVPPPPSVFRPDADTSLDALCLKCLQKYPHDRYASAEQLGRELAGFLGQKWQGPPAETTTQASPGPPTRAGRILVAATALGLVLPLAWWLPNKIPATPSDQADHPSAAPEPSLAKARDDARQATGYLLRNKQGDPAKLAEAYQTRGDARRTLSEFQGAVEDFAAALELQPDLPEALLGRARSYQSMGQRWAARRDFWRLRDLLGPSDPRAGEVETTWRALSEPQPLLEELTEFFRVHGDEFDLAEAALLLASHETPGLDRDTYLDRLDELGDQLRAQLSGTPAHLHLQVVGNFLQESGFRFESGLDDSRRMRIDQVLERGPAIQVTLGLLAQTIAERAGVTIELVLASSVLAASPHSDLLLDFQTNTLISREVAYQAWDTERRGPRPGNLLSPRPKRDTVVRLLANLRIAHTRRQAWSKAIEVTDLMLATENLPFELRKRGHFHLEMKAYEEGIADLRSYLEKVPAAPDRSEVERLVASAKTALARQRSP